MFVIVTMGSGVYALIFPIDKSSSTPKNGIAEKTGEYWPYPSQYERTSLYSWFLLISKTQKFLHALT